MRPLGRESKAPCEKPCDPTQPPSCPGAKPTCESQPQMPPWGRESSAWHLSPIAKVTPCLLPQLSLLFLDGDKEEASWEQSRRAQEWIWCLDSLNIWTDCSSLQLIHFKLELHLMALFPYFSTMPRGLEQFTLIAPVLDFHLEVTDKVKKQAKS